MAGGRAAGRPSAFRWNLLLGLGLLAALIILLATHYREELRLRELLAEAKPAWLFVAALLQLGTYASSASVWRTELSFMGYHLRLRSLIPLAVQKLAIDQLVPTGGIGGRASVVRVMERDGVPRPIATGAVMADLLTFYGAHAVALAAALVLLWLKHDLRLFVLGLTAAFVVLATVVPFTLLWLTGGHPRVPDWLGRIPPLKRLIEVTRGVPSEMTHTPSLYARGVGFQLLIFLLDAATLATMLRAMGNRGSFLTAFTALVLAEATETVGPIPGGIGTFEAVSVAILSTQKVPLGVALAATLLLRGFTLWLPLAPGIWFSRKVLYRAPPRGHASARGPG